MYNALEYLCAVFVLIPSFPTFFHQTSTLPVVIVSNANQISSAWASILWFIILSTDAKVRTCLLNSCFSEVGIIVFLSLVLGPTFLYFGWGRPLILLA